MGTEQQALQLKDENEAPLHSATREYTVSEEKPLGQALTRWVRHMFGGKSAEASLKEALEEVMEEHREESGETLSSDERDMLRNMLLMGELTVSDVMIPRTEIVAVDHDITLTELKAVLQEQRHTRMPVYKGTLDRLLGFIHLKDLVPALAGDEAFDIDKVMRDILFVAPSMKVVDLLVQMRVSGDHMAIVVDEYGGTDGLVTLEDLFEEIVGEIQDEHDEEVLEQELRRISLFCFEADARMRIDVLEKELDTPLRAEDEDEGDYDTLGGLIFMRLGRVPARGEILQIDGVARLEIMDADPRRIRKVKITLRKQYQTEEHPST